MKEPGHEEYDEFDEQVWLWLMLAVVVVSILSLVGVITIELLRAVGIPL